MYYAVRYEAAGSPGHLGGHRLRPGRALRGPVVGAVDLPGGPGRVDRPQPVRRRRRHRLSPLEERRQRRRPGRRACGARRCNPTGWPSAGQPAELLRYDCRLGRAAGRGAVPGPGGRRVLRPVLQRRLVGVGRLRHRLRHRPGAARPLPQGDRRPAPGWRRNRAWPARAAPRCSPTPTADGASPSTPGRRPTSATSTAAPGHCGSSGSTSAGPPGTARRLRGAQTSSSIGPAGPRRAYHS